MHLIDVHLMEQGVDLTGVERGQPQLGIAQRAAELEERHLSVAILIPRAHDLVDGSCAQ